MKNEKYVAYVGTYTHGSSKGIHIYDLDVTEGTMELRKVLPINNPSYITKSHNGRFLYAISDEGVEVLRILPDGDLEPMNKVGIDGMRGCYLSTDINDRYLFVGGYHDGKVTVVHLHKDGRLGSVMDGIFHKGLGSVGERNFRSHITCVLPTPDDKYLCAVDNGIDNVKIYQVNDTAGKLYLVDILRCELESAPRLLKFSVDGKYAYLICELSNEINVYSYDGTGEVPRFELLQTVPTTESRESGSAAAGMELAPNGEYLYCTSAGDNTATIFSVDKETGFLTKICNLPISGNYPKDIDVFPDLKYMIILNHESNEIRIFCIDYDKKIFYMKGRPNKVETPNCILISKVKE